MASSISGHAGAKRTSDDMRTYELNKEAHHESNRYPSLRRYFCMQYFVRVVNINSKDDSSHPGQSLSLGARLSLGELWHGNLMLITSMIGPVAYSRGRPQHSFLQLS